MYVEDCEKPGCLGDGFKPSRFLDWDNEKESLLSVTPWATNEQLSFLKKKKAFISRPLEVNERCTGKFGMATDKFY